MRRWFVFQLGLLCMALVFTSCHKEDTPEVSPCGKTLFMYMPWSGDRNALTSYFYTNISDMEDAVREVGLDDERVVVFLSTSSSEAIMFEITYADGACQRVTLKEYTSPAFTTIEGLTSILNDVKSFAPAQSYAMTIGCHGMGWLPVYSSRSRSVDDTFKPHWEYEHTLPTRYFGGTSSMYQTDINTLKESLEQAGMPMEYILFDDCYMSSIEVAYALRHVADYLIACPTEIMAFGMPYAEIGRYLLGEPDYASICQEFYEFYSTYQYPYATFGITDCSELDALASLMREINGQYTFDDSQRRDLQPMDGYTPTIFYDYGDYVAHLCGDPALFNQFQAQLERTVLYKAHTGRYFSAAGGIKPIWTFSGITTSAPSTSSQAADWIDTEWYQDTH